MGASVGKKEQIIATHDDEKRDLEKWAGMTFLPLYNAETGKQFRLVHLQDRPDLLLEAPNGTQLGLEVAHFYPGKDDAKKLYGRPSTAPPRKRAPADFDPETLRLDVTKLNELLEQKQEKGRSYDCHHPVLLLILSASPLLTWSDFMRFCDEIRAPGGVYHETWLLPLDDDRAGYSRLIRLQ